MRIKKMSDKKKLLIFVIGNILLSILIPILLFTFNLWPQGNDVWGHLFKAEFLLDEIRKGNLFPIISPYWYNTIELFRYWPPFTYYIIALISLIFNIKVESVSLVRR